MDFQDNLLILKLGDIDAILGMNWMTQHQCVIQFIPKSIEMRHPSGRTILLYVSKSHQLALHSLRAKPKVTEGVELVLVVCEFTNVFLEELTGMSSKRDVEFLIHLEPRTLAISKPLYKMAPKELEELKRQLLDLLEKGYIQPSS